MNLDLKNLSQDEEQPMSATLEQLFEEVINEDEDFKSTMPTESYTRLRKAVCKTFQRFLLKGWRITSAKHECVQFHIRCSNFTSLAALFREHIQGKIINNELTDLKEAISECLGGKEAQLETVIYKDEFWSVMDKTVSAVDAFLNDQNGDSIPTLHRKLLPSADKKKHTLTLTARNVNHDGLQSFNEECVNELDSCARLLETELGTEFNASHVSVQTSYTPKMPEKTKDKVRSDDKYTATPKEENIEKEFVNFPSTRKSVSGVELQSHGSHSKTSASADSSDKEQTIALLELYRSQIAVAHFFGLVYKHAHGEFESKIYLTIQSARSAHEMSHFLPTFPLDSLSRRLPYILRRFIGERFLQMGYVESAIHHVRHLKDDAMELQGRYTKLLDAISSDIKLLTIQRKTKTANERDKMSDVPSVKFADVDRSKAKKGMYEYDEYISTFILPERLRISDSSDEDTDFGRNKLPEKMIAERKTAEYTGKYNLKHDEGKGQSKAKKYDDWRYTMGKRIPFGVVDFDTVLTKLRPGSALTGGLSLKETNPSEMFRSIRHEKKSGTLTKVMNQTQGQPGTVKPSFVHQTKYIEEVDSLETIREQEGKTCIEYLQQVYKHLKYIDLQLTRIADSWSNLSTALEQLKANEETLRLQTVSSRPDFNEKIDMLEKEWIFVSKTFKAYCDEDFHVKQLYDFLTERIRCTDIFQTRNRIH